MLSKNEAFFVVGLNILLIKVTHLFVYKSFMYITCNCSHIVVVLSTVDS